MDKARTVEIFSAGCPICAEPIARVRELARRSCEVLVLDARHKGVANRATKLGIRSPPAVVIDGKLADCCVGRDLNEDVLRAAGLGQPIP